MSADGRELVDAFAHQIEEAVGDLVISFRPPRAEVEAAFAAVHAQVVAGGWHELVVEGPGTGEDAAVLAAIVEAAARIKRTAPYPFAESFAARRLLKELGLDELARDPGSITAALGNAIEDDGPLVFGYGQWTDHRYFLTAESDGAFALRDAAADALDPAALQQPDHTRPHFALRSGAAASAEVIARVPREAAVRAAAELVLFEAAEQLGAAGALFDATVTYLNQREQFGAPLSSFQALRHRIVDVFAQLETLRSLVGYASWAADARPESLLEFAAMAKGYGSRIAWHAGSEAIQMHGAMGFTWEQGLQVPLGRVMSLALTSPSGAYCLELVGRRVLERGELVSLLQ